MTPSKMKLVWRHVGPIWLKGGRYLPSNLTAGLSGIYLIHRRTPGGREVIKIGEGQIQSRLRQHRRDREIVGEGVEHSLSLTWAEARKGVELLMIERYLTDCYSPKFGSVHRVPGLAVNRPFRSWKPFDTLK